MFINYIHTYLHKAGGPCIHTGIFTHTHTHILVMTAFLSTSPLPTHLKLLTAAVLREAEVYDAVERNSSCPWLLPGCEREARHSTHLAKML